MTFLPKPIEELLAELERTGKVLVSPGVMVERDRNGQDVAVAYGGHRSRMDQAAVVAATRAALANWPRPVVALRIVVTEDPAPMYDDQQKQAAAARRARRAKRPQGVS